MQQLAQDPHLLQFLGVGQQFLAAGAGAIQVDGRVDAFLCNAAVEVNLGVAGSLEFLVDHVIHARTGIDQRRRKNSQAATFLDVTCGTKEAFRALQGVGIDATGEHLAG